jgi:anti-sigma factor ChrR (cupin superfamily)
VSAHFHLHLKTPLNRAADPPLPYPRIELRDLFSIARWQETIPWQPFKDGFEIHRLYGDGITGPTAALLRCRESGTLPLHQHLGYEHILLLTGSERDQNGVASTGTLTINPPGSSHRVASDEGSIVLAIWQAPVKIL